jgi:hypothetical protein
LKPTGSQAAANAVNETVRPPAAELERDPAALRRLHRLRSGSLERVVGWLPPFVFLALALSATWPWALRPSTVVMAPTGGDVSTSISKFNAIVASGAVPFISDRITSVGFPDGLHTTPGVDSAAGLSTLYLWVGSAVIGPVQAHGLLAVLGFFLTATITYLFVRRVTGSVGAGLVAGIAYGFFPHLRLMAAAATTYTHMWLFILALWAFWNLSQAPTRRNAVLAGASLVPSIFWTPYYALHVSVLATACCIVLFLVAPQIELRRRRLALVAVPWVSALVVYVGIGVVTSFSDAPDRPLSDFYEQAAHPLMYVWPGVFTGWGSGIYEALVRHVPRASNANIYVGLSVIALGAIAVFANLGPWLRRRFRGRPSPQAMAALLALAVVVASFACSMPPRVLQHHVPTPSTLIFHVTPGLRAGQRFVMPLMAGAAVLAGLGTAAVLRRLPRTAMLPVAAAIALVVAVDLRTNPPGMPAELTAHPPALEALAQAPKAPAVEVFPWGILGGQPQRACMAQLVHKKLLVNTCSIGPAPPRVANVALQPMCRALRQLHGSGLRYVIVDLPVPDNVKACFRRRSSLGGWRVLAQDAQYRVLELRATS